MSGLGADEIIASVMCRSDNHVVRSKRLESIFQDRSRQVWAVAVERDHALLPRCKMCKHRGESCRKAFSLLRHDCTASPARPQVLRHPRAGHMIATSTLLNERASVTVSSKRQR